MSSDFELEDEVEEVRELLYDIVKKAGPHGIETSLLAKEYEKQFVDCGIGQPLPSAWLRYIKVADEFDMRNEGDKIYISVIQRDNVPLQQKVASIVKETLSLDDEEIVDQDIKLKPLPLSGMPQCKTKVHILAATDPNNISIRLCAWDPMPDYLYSALAKDFSDESKKRKRIKTVQGRICVAKLPNGSWERVQIVKPSVTMGHKGYWVVFAVDVGVFHLAHEKYLQPLSDSVCAFDKVLLAKCELTGIKPNNETGIWSRNAQQAINNWLSEVQGTEIDLEPVSEWKMSKEEVPVVNARLSVNGEDLAKKLIENGYAQASE
ncbi:unnamed protein product [Bursaphelenchus xylophilus]|uniref:(pine wood nematode) hypothetical protein n=1 Tax=Bursaphelenchus xylophilus TaxID=6326 RepID=A0A1I7SUA7_BURXY|nr:unnamed protein product [Bursaphelenchus xylophilus]CAG9107364.1 unnamed protein product [Bursaphelenchus xylophilus]